MHFKIDQWLPHQKMVVTVTWWDVVPSHVSNSIYPSTTSYGSSPGVGDCGCPSHCRLPPTFLALDWRGRARPCCTFGVVLDKTHWGSILKFPSHASCPLWSRQDWSFTWTAQSSYKGKFAARWPTMWISHSSCIASTVLTVLRFGSWSQFFLPLILPAVSVGYFLCHFISQTIVFYCWKMCVSFQRLGITHTCHWM